jgi:hypothetical protein
MNKKDLYKGGINPIYESMMNSMLEDKEKGKDKSSESMDSVSILSTAMNTFFSILLNSKMENAKTVRGFQEIKNKVLGTTNFGSFRQYMISVLDSLAAMDPAQKEAYQKNIQFIKEVLSKAEQSLSDPKIFDSIKKDTVTKLLTSFEGDLKEREAQMKKTNPKLFGEVVKQGLVVKEEKEINEDSTEEEEFRGKAFNKSKESLDAATAFVGMIERDKYVAVLKDNADIKRYVEIAENLLKRAQDLQMLDRKGLRNIVTPSGEIKRNDYMRQQDSLINDIIRQKKEYQRIKDGALKQGGLSTPPEVIPVCPPGKVYDPGKGICVSTGEDSSQATSATGDQQETKPTTDCQFPVNLKTKCNQVGDLQAKLIEIIPSVKSYLSKKGGADKIYGKGTAAVSNIVWGYLSGNTGQDLKSPLTKEMYDAIMKLTADDIDTTTSAVVSAAIKDNKNWEMSISQKIQEREEIKGAPILSFEDFYSVIEESYSFQKIDEDGEPKSIGDQGPPPIASKKLKDSCIADSIAQGKVLPCVAGATDGTQETGTGTKDDVKWEGLKPVEDNIYVISYDESALSALGKAAIGAAAGVAVVASGGAALAAFAPAALGAAAVSASAFAGTSLMALSGATLALTTPVAVGAGIIGGAGVAEAMAGRANLAITVTSGFITRGAIRRIVRGLINTLDGRVSDNDIQAIMSSLAILKGAWTCNTDETKAISAWSEVKKLYTKQENEDLISEINSIGTLTVSDVENFPEFSSKTLEDGADTNSDDAMNQIKEAIERLNANESKLITNLSKITPEIIEQSINGSSMVRKEEAEESEE